MASRFWRRGIGPAAFIVIAAGLAAPTAAAAASPGGNPADGVTVTLTPSATAVTSGRSVTVSGTMTENDNSQPVPGSPVTVFAVDAYDNEVSQTADTNSSGDWSAAFTIATTSTIYAESADYPSNLPQAAVSALAKVSLKLTPTVAQPYLLDPAKVTVAPAGTAYVLQTERAGTSRWNDAPDTTGVWGAAPGEFLVRLVTSGNSVIAATTSAPVKVTVKNGQVPAWLRELNRYRALNDADPVALDPVLSKDDALHVRYMIKTGDFTHYENPKSKWYTAGGAEAGENSDLAFNFPDAINAWARAPYHALAELAKQGTLAGYAQGDGYAALWVDQLTSDRRLVQPLYQFPANGSTTSMLTYSGGETPNPVARCHPETGGYGLPVIYGNQDYSTKPTATLTTDGKRVRACVVNDVDVVFVIALSPLARHHTYHVAVYYQGKLQSRWQFTTR